MSKEFSRLLDHLLDGAGQRVAIVGVGVQVADDDELGALGKRLHTRQLAVEEQAQRVKLVVVAVGVDGMLSDFSKSGKPDGTCTAI